MKVSVRSRAAVSAFWFPSRATDFGGAEAHRPRTGLDCATILDAAPIVRTTTLIDIQERPDPPLLVEDIR